MVNINIKKDEVKVKVSDLKFGDFFLLKNSFGGEDLCQVLLSGDRIKKMKISLLLLYILKLEKSI